MSFKLENSYIINDVTTNGNIINGDSDMDSSGNFYTCGVKSNQGFLIKTNSSGVEQWRTSGVGSNAQRCATANAPNGKTWIVYPTSANTTRASSYTSTGVISVNDIIISTGTTNSSGEPSADVDSSNNAFLQFDDSGNRIFITKKTDAGGAGSGPIISGTSLYGNIIVDGSNNVWNVYNTSSQTYFRKYSNTLTASISETAIGALTTSSNYSELTRDSSNNIYFIYDGVDGSDKKVLLGKVNSSGTEQYSDVEIFSSTSITYDRKRIAIDETNGYLACAFGQSVNVNYIQLTDLDGGKIGSPFEINSGNNVTRIHGVHFYNDFVYVIFQDTSTSDLIMEVYSISLFTPKLLMY